MIPDKTRKNYFVNNDLDPEEYSVIALLEPCETEDGYKYIIKFYGSACSAYFKYFGSAVKYLNRKGFEFYDNE